MAELPNKNRTQSGTRGLRGRGRTRPADSGNTPSTAPKGNVGTGQRRPADGNRNTAQAGNQPRRPARPGKPAGKMDSESDFRAIRQSGNQNRTAGSSDDFLNGNSINPGNRARPNGRRNENVASGNRRQMKPARNGQDWSPSSDSHSYTGFHQLKGSDWYREDQARYAARQIALENSESAGTDSNRGKNTNAKGPASTDNKRNNGQRGRNRGNNRNRPNPNQRTNAKQGNTVSKPNPNRRHANGQIEASSGQPTTATDGAVNNTPNAAAKATTNPAEAADTTTTTTSTAPKRPARRKAAPKQSVDKTADTEKTAGKQADSAKSTDKPAAKRTRRASTTSASQDKPADSQNNAGTSGESTG